MKKSDVRHIDTSHRSFSENCLCISISFSCALACKKSKGTRNTIHVRSVRLCDVIPYTIALRLEYRMACVMFSKASSYFAPSLAASV